MMRSLFAGVAGLKNHQTRMDVIGNNIANVNTVGFKRGRVNFQEMLVQTLRGASSPQSGRGGVNAMQVGLGVSSGSIDTIQTQGNLQSTGKNTDMAMQGDGYFVLQDGSGQVFTRSGVFDLDKDGNLVNSSNGMKVMGWMANPVTGVIDTNSALTTLQVPMGQSMEPKETSQITFANNLDASAVSGVTPDHVVSLDTFDSLGTAHKITTTFHKNAAANEWQYTVSKAATDPSVLAGTVTGTITFNPDGSLPAAASPTAAFTLDPANTTPITVTLDISQLTQYSSASTAIAQKQDGNDTGTLQSFAIDSAGVVTGIFSNGFSKELGQVGIANFNNPGGLIKVADNIFKRSNNSGLEQMGTANTGGRGSITPGALEMSNVDLSQEFTDMITTQRGFQANSRIITTSDEMLQELVNLKR